jgi:cellulose synthase/poly-beta-1,6-N-acetylglucosamine synthase-like glycosyltransferase
MLISVYNEEAIIASKLMNALAQEYPHDRMMIVVSSDGSTDSTNEIVRDMAVDEPRLSLRAYSENRGKTAALMDSLRHLPDSTEVVVFSDANGIYSTDAVRMLARHFDDPKVGAVAGRLEYTDSGGEASYRRYENAIKTAEGRLGACTAAEGSIFAARRALIPVLDPSHVEDLAIPLSIALRGYAVRFEPDAWSREAFALGRAAQFRRRRRIVNRAIRSAWALRREFRHNRLVSWMFLSHRALRWAGPIPVLGGTVGSLLVIDALGGALVLVSAAASVTTLVALGGVAPRRLRGLTEVPLAFVVANAAVVAGAASALIGSRATRWTPERA